VSAEGRAVAVRAGAGLFRLGDRGLLSVQGGDRVRWLDGMLSNDITALAPGPESSGCYALLLTRQGRIVADFHVLLREECVWLEVARDGLPHARETLERFIIADDVVLGDVSDEVERLGLEGPAAGAVLAAALGRRLELADDACAEVKIAGVRVLVAAFGWSGAPARQLFAPRAEAERVAAVLLEAGAGLGLLEAGTDTLEILRVEAGIPALGRELDEEVLPAEARLERAISTEKGCYTGQEVVARMHSRGRVGHLLVGLRSEQAPPPEPGAEIVGAGRKLGEVTSSCVSAADGPIALGYVRAAHAEPGSRVLVDGRPATLAALPFPVASAS
jgi:folate-binding protein YgfZ